jgi:hypothetical protein
VKEWRASPYRGRVDLFAGGVPCPPFSRAGQRLGASDDRDLFPTAVQLIAECRPRAVMLENVRRLLSPDFDQYRRRVAPRIRCCPRPAPRRLELCPESSDRPPQVLAQAGASVAHLTP